MGLLDRAGARLTSRPEDAEILVVNTCSFIDTAKQESVDTILEMARHQDRGPREQADRCRLPGRALSRRDPQEHPRSGRGGRHGRAGGHSGSGGRSPGPQGGFAVQHPQQLGLRQDASRAGEHLGRSRCAETHKHEQPAFRPEGDLREQQGRFTREEWDGAAHMLPTYLYDETTPRLLATGKTSAYIKIAEGCDHPCTFCVIPNLRGKFRSRRFESVVAEAQSLVARGVQEITLIGQDTTCYGEDLGLKDGLALLLDALAQIEGLRWLRFLVCLSQSHHRPPARDHCETRQYLQVSRRSAAARSPDVLKTMKRGAGADIFLKTLEKVRAAVPGIALRTSFIVGFPGETPKTFRFLEDFVKAAKFDWLGVFSYSDEEGSGAYSLDAKVAKRTIECAQTQADEAAARHLKEAKQQWVGRELVLLAEGESEETPMLWEGRTQFHAPEIDGKVYINDFGDLEASKPDVSTRPRSPRPTTTT